VWLEKKKDFNILKGKRGMISKCLNNFVRGCSFQMFFLTGSRALSRNTWYISDCVWGHSVLCSGLRV